MIDVIRQQFNNEMTDQRRLDLTREFLQILCLKILDDKKHSQNIAFVGGTSLRILFNLNRYSEDLDFSLINKGNYAPSEIENDFKKSFRLYGLPVEVKTKTETTVHVFLLRFEGLLKQLGLSPMASQKITIKMEIDTNPPSGAIVTERIVQKSVSFGIKHYDLPSLFAGKLHACFYRRFIKGRDFYDLLWYVNQKIHPNYILLNNAIKQTQGVAPSPEISKETLKNFLLTNIQKIDFKVVHKDVERFVIDINEINYLTLERIVSTIETLY